MNIIIAQIFGLLALITLSVSYQKENKKDFLYMQILANSFYMIQYFLLGVLSASLANLVGATRGVVISKQEAKNKRSIITLIIFEIILIITGILTCDSFISVIPIVLAMSYTYGIWQKNLKITYFIAILVSIAWIFVNYKVGAYVSVIASILELVSSSTGLIKLIKTDKQ